MSSSQSKYEKLHPLSLVFYSASVELIFLLPSFLFFELPKWTSKYMVGINPIYLWLAIISNCTLMFGLRFITNEAIQVTSALTTTVFAQVKFIVSILVSILFFNYQLSFARFCGLVLVVGGTFLYAYTKVSKKVEKDDDDIV